jgi:hypothetical protein
VFGAFVITLDLIFSGRAWSFIFGVFASTASSLYGVHHNGLGVVAWTIDFESRPEDAAAVAELVRGAIGAGIAGMEKALLHRPG